MDLNMPDIFIKVPRGACPYCGSTVRILESELNESVLGPNGYPKSTENISYSCVGYCCSCDKPVYIDPTGNGYITIPFNDNAIGLHDKIKEILGDVQGVLRSDIPIILDIPDSQFVKK